MAWRQAWHPEPKVQVLGLLWTMIAVTAYSASAEIVQGCPEGQQGIAAAEAAGAAAESSTPSLFQKQVLTCTLYNFTNPSAAACHVPDLSMRCRHLTSTMTKSSLWALEWSQQSAPHQLSRWS